MIKGLIIGGDYGSILVRQKTDTQIELGELLIAEIPTGKILLTAYDLLYGSQLTQQHLELISGLKLEEDNTLEILDKSIRTYVLAKLKSLAHISKEVKSTKVLPPVMTQIREVTPLDLTFITTPQNPLTLGQLRSGSKKLDVPCSINGKDALSHHILITGTTGRGKSTLMTNILTNALTQDYCSFLVLDPHDEYNNRLKNHPNARERTLYYKPHQTTPGAITLTINLTHLKPHHFNGVINFSDPQKQALNAYYNQYRKEWIEAIITEKEIPNQKFHEGTLAVVKRTLMQLLSIDIDDTKTLRPEGIFQPNAGHTTITDITNALTNGKTVIIDTSSFNGNTELLIGSLLATHILDHNKKTKTNNVISIVLEEAPRVLGKDVLEKGSNIFATIAREGRKFNVGLTAITQLPSLIPRQILANINTKIILGIELKPERTAIIESAAHDLSDDERMIASLDKGEAIVTSNFLRFPMPIAITPIQETQQNKPTFTGIKLT